MRKKENLTKIEIPLGVYSQIRFYTEDVLLLSGKELIKLQTALTDMWVLLDYTIRNSDSTDIIGFTPIHSKNPLFNRFDLVINEERYRSSNLINILSDIGLLIVNNSYSNNGQMTHNGKTRTKSYKLINSYEEYMDYYINLQKIFKYKTQEFYNKEYPKHTKTINNLYNIEIDTPALYEYLKSNIGMKLKTKYIKGTNQINKNRVLTQDIISFIMIQAHKINNKLIWYSHKDRVYNSFTNLPSICDDFITFNGHKLVQLDVVNCQPLLLSMLTKDIDFQRVCESGKFYETLMEETGIEDRDKMKIISYRDIFYGKFKQHSKIGKAFTKLFPMTADYLKQNEKNLAKQMQKIEAEIFVTLVNTSRYSVLCKHDAIYTIPPFEERMRNLIISRFSMKGLSVEIK